MDCGNYVGDVFDANTGIWWHCDDNETTKISDVPEVVYTRESFFKGRKLCQDQK